MKNTLAVLTLLASVTLASTARGQGAENDQEKSGKTQATLSDTKRPRDGNASKTGKHDPNAKSGKGPNVTMDPLPGSVKKAPEGARQL